jgi:transposase
VIDMELLSVIRRWHYRDRFSIREISRRTGLSRNTVRKYLRSDSVEPKFRVPDRPSKLDPYADKLSHMLRQETGKARKQKRTIKQLYVDLINLGYDGSYNRVAAFARDWKAARQRELKTCGRGVFVPLAFQPGEAFQFDWSEDWAFIGGERTKLQVAHFKLCYSRAFVLRAYPQQTHEMLFDAHNHAFRVLGGVPRRGIFDNMRTAARSARSTRVSRPWSATSCSRPSSAIRRPAGRRARSRRTSEARAPSAVAAHAELSLPGGAERLAGDAMPGAMGADPTRLAAGLGSRGLGRGSATSDAAFQAV